MEILNRIWKSIYIVVIAGIIFTSFHMVYSLIIYNLNNQKIKSELSKLDIPKDEVEGSDKEWELRGEKTEILVQWDRDIGFGIWSFILWFSILFIKKWLVWLLTGKKSRMFSANLQ